MMYENLLLNPVILSVLLLCIMCLCKVNVLLSLIISAIFAGVVAKVPIAEVMNTFVSGMGGNSETALSYILLGTFAAAMIHTGLTNIISNKVSIWVKYNKFLLISIIVLFAVMSQNVVPVHIAFIPILIPPLLKLMNKLKIDRRVISCALAFGLKTPYIVLPAGFGLIFQGLIADNLTQNGLTVLRDDIWKSVWILGVGMLCGLLFSIFISYKNNREYNDNVVFSEIADETQLKINKSHILTMIAALFTFLIQLITKSLPLGAIAGLSIIFTTGVISHKKTDKMISEGVSIMGYIAFVMLIAAGYAMVLKETGGIESLVNGIMPYMQDNKLLIATFMMFVGLIVTIGIGTSFGTIPILAVLFVPICQSAGFSTATTVVLVAAAAALGDAGSPASDTTLGPTSGLNFDGQHNHIKDTCIPTFLHYNIPLILFALIAVFIF